MKNKGFTLIELLAVIVILAIIALIATPIILGIISDARREARVRSAEAVASAVKTAYITSQMKVEASGSAASFNNETVMSNTKINNEVTTSRTSTSITTKDGIVCTLSSSYVLTCTYDGENVIDPVTITGTSQEPEDTYAYMWYTGEDADGPSIGDDASSLATSVPSDKSFYLKFKLNDENEVTNSYACIKYTDTETNELVEACGQGGDSSYYGTYDGFLENTTYDDVSDKNPTGNIKIISDIKTSFERSFTNANCAFDSSYSGCYSDSLTLEFSSDGYVYSTDHSSPCQVYSDGSSYFGS